ncbi:MAG: DUF333 domain-containing protein [Candidatus Kuenenbacteria bacterium]
MKKIIFIPFGIICLFSFIFLMPCKGNAVETNSENAPVTINNAIPKTTETTVIKEPVIETASQEVLIDEKVLASDLEIKEPKLLPDNRFYFLKNWQRGIKSFFTFNPVAKAELKLKFANEKLIEVKKLAEKTNNSKILKEAINNYKEEINGLEKATEKIKEKIENPKVNKFVEKFIDNNLKQQKVLDNLEKKLPSETYEDLAKTKEETLQKFSDVALKFIPKEALGEKISGIIEKQTGSGFREFKNLEILNNLKEKVPEIAKPAIEQAINNSMINLKKNIEKVGEKEKIKDYLSSINGNEIKHLEIIDQLKNKGLSADVVQEIEKGKEKIFTKIEKKLENFDEKKLDGAKEKFLEDLSQGLDSKTIEPAKCPLLMPPSPNACNGEWVSEKNSAGCSIFKCLNASGDAGEIFCAKQGEKINRNPFLGSLDQKCCLNLFEQKISKSYSICQKEKSSEKEIPSSGVKEMPSAAEAPNVTGASDAAAGTSVKKTPFIKNPIGMPNPASVYCEKMGYKLELKTEENGQYAICIFPDGTKCEERAFFRGECGEKYRKEIDVNFRPTNKNDASSSGNVNLRPTGNTMDVNSQHIIEKDLKNGWYYGQKSQKKSGTPKNWVWQWAEKNSRWMAPWFIEKQGIKEWCKNGKCDEPKENAFICYEDCKPKEPKPADLSGCGNGKCEKEKGENIFSCNKDCNPICGDNQCVDGETCSSCSRDCGECPKMLNCGDRICQENEGENIFSCLKDCKPFPNCGDGICNEKENENSFTCQKDCD